jgi:N-methylhydantoinase B
MNSPDKNPVSLDPALLAVLANRFENVCREMTNTLLRSGRSAVLAMARDFSCALVTADNRLLASAEGIPVHVFGSHFLTQAMCDLHDDLAEGDAFLHNDPYLGNTHPADHTILVPVFFNGEHLFTAAAKAHQADCGNAQPTTYMPFARDVYEEGSLTFPCVRIQRNYKDVADIIRMCKRRIRVPEQWYGDYLAMLGAARVAERRLKELVQQYGRDLIQTFVKEWFEYSERRMIHAIRQLPSGELVARGKHDPLPSLPEGIPLKVSVKVFSEEGRIEIDLRDNIDCVPAGLNESQTCSMNNSMTGIFNSIDPTVPHNAGSFRRITILMRENCVVGIPLFPASCSVATTNVGDRLINTMQAAFAEADEGAGLAEGGLGMGPGWGVISGKDQRRGNAPYVNQLFLTNNGGPGSPKNDGWVNFGVPAGGGLLYRDSIEIDEQKYPMIFREFRLIPDSGGAGRFRGGPAGRVVYGPHKGSMTVIYPLDGHQTPPKGVRGGHAGALAYATKLDKAGKEIPLPPVSAEEIGSGEYIVGVGTGGGGYGDPLQRDPARVLKDVIEKWVTAEQAKDVYGVVFNKTNGSMEVDTKSTSLHRENLKRARK